MTIQVPLGDVAKDNFPIFEADGYTKKSGETSFTTTIRKDSVVQAIASSIAEDGTTGEYVFSFTPDTKGSWSVEVLIDYNKDIWYGEFAVGVGVEAIVFQASMADDGVTAVFGIWIEENGVRRTDITSMSAVLKDTAGGTIINMGTNTTPTVDGIFRFTSPSANLAPQVPYVITVSATDSIQTWNNNLGLAKSD